MKQEMHNEPMWGGQEGSKFGGVFLILLGVIFFLSQSGVRILGHSPWLLFMFLPLFFALYGVWRQYEANGRKLNGKIISMLIWGFFPFLFAGAFIFGLNGSLLMPLMFIGMGIAVIVGQLR